MLHSFLSTIEHDNWLIKSNNFSTLCTNPTQYLAPILQGPDGNWKLDKILSNVTGTENTIFSILSERFFTAEYIDDSNHPRCGQLALTVPLRATLEGATVYVHPDGKIEFDLNKYPIDLQISTPIFSLILQEVNLHNRTMVLSPRSMFKLNSHVRIEVRFQEHTSNTFTMNFHQHQKPSTCISQEWGMFFLHCII